MVEDNIQYSELLGEALSQTDMLHVELTFAGRLSSALETLTQAQDSFDLILIDLFLPDSRGLDTFSAIHTQALHIPILVLTADTDESMAIQAVREGAQDYLVKDQLTPILLARSIQNAIERHRAGASVAKLSLLDELTGLYNRRGFYSLAERHLKLSHRTGQKLLLIFADLDGLKQVNDTFGHQEGDRVLLAAAEILRATFRSSDIICRLGGDEFMILAIEAKDGDAAALAMRLQQNIACFNARNPLYSLNLSWGVASFDPGLNPPLEALVSQADKALYQHKRSKGEAA